MEMWSHNDRSPTEILEAEIQRRPSQHFVSEEDSNDPLRRVKVETARILCASQHPMTESEILLVFRKLNEPLDTRKWGFNSLTDLMLGCNDRFHAYLNRCGQYEFTLIPNKRTTSLSTPAQSQVPLEERVNRPMSRGDGVRSTRYSFEREMSASSEGGFASHFKKEEPQKSASFRSSFASHFKKQEPQGAQKRSQGREWTDEFDEGWIQRGKSTTIPSLMQNSTPLIPTREVTPARPPVDELSRSTSRSTSREQVVPLLFPPRKVKLVSGLLERYGTRLWNGDYELELEQLRSHYYCDNKIPLAGGFFFPRIIADQMACFDGAPWVVEVEPSEAPGPDNQYFVILKTSSAETSLSTASSFADPAEKSFLAHSPSQPFRIHLTRELVKAASIKYPEESVPASFFYKFAAKSISDFNANSKEKEGIWTREEILKIGREQLGASLPPHLQTVIESHSQPSRNQQRFFRQKPHSDASASGNCLLGNEVLSPTIINPAVSTSVLEKTACQLGSSSTAFSAQETVEKSSIPFDAGLLIKRTEKFLDDLMDGKQMTLKEAREKGVEEVVHTNPDLFHVKTAFNTKLIVLSRHPPYDCEKLVFNAAPSLREELEAATNHQVITKTPKQSEGQNEDVLATQTASSMKSVISLGVNGVDSNDVIVEAEDKSENSSGYETASTVEHSIPAVVDEDEVTKKEVDSDEDTIMQMEPLVSVDPSEVDSYENDSVSAEMEAAQPSLLSSLHKVNPFISPHFFTRPLDSSSPDRLIMASLVYPVSAKTLLLCDTTNKNEMEERGQRLQTTFRELYADASSWNTLVDPHPACLAVAVGTDNQQFIRVVLLHPISESDCWLAACLDANALVNVHKERLLLLDESRFGLEQEPASIFTAHIHLLKDDIPESEQWLSSIVEKVNEGAVLLLPSFSTFIYMDGKVQSYKVEMLLRWPGGQESVRDGEQSREFLSGLLHRFQHGQGRITDRVPRAADFLKFEKRVPGLNDDQNVFTASVQYGVSTAANASTSPSKINDSGLTTDILTEFKQLVERAKKVIGHVKTEGALRAIPLLEQAVEVANH